MSIFSDILDVGKTVAAVVGIGSDILGGVKEAEGNQEVAKANAEASRYRASVARDNAVIAQKRAADTEGIASDYAKRLLGDAEVLALDALDRGDVAAQRQALEVKQVISKQRVALAGNGVVVDQGSGLNLTRDAAAFGALDIATIRSNAKREAYGYRKGAEREAFAVQENARRTAEALRIEGKNFEADAVLAEMSAGSSLKAGDISTTGTILGTVGSVASKWYSYTDEGVFDSIFGK